MRAPGGRLPVWAWVVGFHAVCFLAAFVLHQGRLVAYAYPAGAVVCCALLLRRRETADFLVFTLWLWFLGPEMRRVVDFGVGWTPKSTVMLAMPVASCVCLVPALRAHRRVAPDMTRALATALTAVVFAFVTGALVNGKAPALGGLLDWLPPVLVGAWAAGAGPETPVLRRALERTALWGAIVLGAYGLVQFLVLPEWDAFWMRNAPINSIGNPHPFQVRVFGTLNSPNPYGAVLGALLIMVLAGARSRGRALATAAGVVGIGLSLVRTAWLGIVIAVGALARAGRTRALVAIVLAATLTVVGLAFVGGPVGEAIGERVANSYQSGGKDKSLNDRTDVYRKTLPVVLGSATGKGLGSTGVSTKLSNAQGKPGAAGTFDSGLLEVLYTYGLPLGLVLLVVLLLAVCAAWRRARESDDDFLVACGAAVAGLLVQLLLGNPLTGAPGVLFWVLLALLSRVRGSGTPVAGASLAEQGRRSRTLV
ncbi:O-antigen ligase-like membrane protein [Motilibacter rhizosphaerae]|uniref:O-antigen ligase-like membrane protein n=1 Tax=Motilibacter rhizosphaerae TaxID=598652 RepID=A0A4Q7NQB4_9ACTN|nr:O-antigen ligase family protein [Motilibacter rhizosphaerae]RZS87403.1 O-antigen ligase-like membrane protein [Motilibacter rhizosphaerae]